MCVLLSQTLPREMLTLLCGYTAVTALRLHRLREPQPALLRQPQALQKTSLMYLLGQVFAWHTPHPAPFLIIMVLGPAPLNRRFGRGMRSAFPLWLRPLFRAPPSGGRPSEAHCRTSRASSSPHLNTAATPTNAEFHQNTRSPFLSCISQGCAI